MIRVLVIEDDAEMRAYLSSILTESQFYPLTMESGRNLQDALPVMRPDVILLDYNLPDKSGAEVLRDLRQDAVFRNIPVLLVTGIVGEEEKIKAFEFGADDYIKKPFSPRELVLRIQAVLRRAGMEKLLREKLEHENLLIDLKSHKVFLDGQEVHLTLTEFRILSELLRSRGQVLSRDRLRETALGNLNVTDRTIDVHMAALRRKLAGHAPRIQTVRGVGYRYN